MSYMVLWGWGLQATQGFQLGIWPLFWNAWHWLLLSPLKLLQIKFWKKKKKDFISKESRRPSGPVGCPFVFRVWTWYALTGPGMDLDLVYLKVFLHTRLGYVPKVQTNVVWSIELQAFSPPPFWTLDEEKLNLLCPVWALDVYVHRVALWWKSDQLTVCFGSPSKGWASR